MPNSCVAAEVSSSLPSTEADIADSLALSAEALWNHARRATAHGYNQFLHGDRGKRRVICAPRFWLKSLQSGLYERVLLKVPVSTRVFSQRGHDVIENAEQHLNQSHMVVLDIENCFPSTKHSMVRDALLRSGFENSAATLLTRLVTYKGALPQGPPTSPSILSVVFAPLDEELEWLAAEFGATYTRYMDDLCFSANRPLDLLARRAERAIRHAGYRVNPAKRRVWGPNDRHTVTKIIVSSSLHPNQDYLEALVHELGRLRHGEFRLSVNRLRGMIDWVARLDADLGFRLKTMLHENACIGRVTQLM